MSSFNILLIVSMLQSFEYTRRMWTTATDWHCKSAVLYAHPNPSPQRRSYVNPPLGTFGRSGKVPFDAPRPSNVVASEVASDRFFLADNLILKISRCRLNSLLDPGKSSKHDGMILTRLTSSVDEEGARVDRAAEEIEAAADEMDDSHVDGSAVARGAFFLALYSLTALSISFCETVGVRIAAGTGSGLAN